MILDSIAHHHRGGSSRKDAGRFGSQLAASAAACLFSLMLANPAPAQDRSKELVVVASGGAFERALRSNFYNPFTEQTGIRVRAVAASYAEQWAKARAMSDSGQTQWDIVTVGIAEEAANRKLLLKLDCASMTNVTRHAIPGACRDYVLWRTLGGTVLVYNKKAYPKGKEPTGWADFWDIKKFPGPRAIPNYGAPYVPVAIALAADGIGVPQLREAPLDIGRAFKKLDQIKPAVSVWWKTGDQSQQTMRDGEAVMAMLWSGRAGALQKSGVPIEIVWQAASAELSSWAILKDAPNKEAAKKFLEFFVTRPEAHLAFSAEIFWDTVNREAIQKTHGSVDAFMKRLDNMIIYDSAWIAANKDMLIARWNEWVSR